MSLPQKGFRPLMGINKFNALFSLYHMKLSYARFRPHQGII